MNGKSRFKSSLIPVLVFITILWIIHLAGILTGVSFVSLGVKPGDGGTMWTIFTFPLVHGSFSHLFSNTVPLLILGTALIFFFPKASAKVIPMIYIIPGFFIWFIGRGSYHIGASGIVYGLAAFLFFAGMTRRDKGSAALALIVVFFYGGLVWGVLPVEEGISWEGHLGGAVAGILAAVIYGREDKTKKYDWEDEEKDYNARDLKISHKREDNDFLFKK